MLFAIFLCASPVEVRAQDRECPNQSPWTPTPEELTKFKMGTGTERPNFCNADLSDANLSGADLNRANLSRANLRSAKLFFADLFSADLIDADLSRADLNGAHLSDAKLRGADLSYAILSRTNLSGADLSYANLTDANLTDAYLIGATLRSASVSRADLNGAYLNRADLREADLRGVNLAWVELGEADLRGVIGLVQFRDLLQKAGLREDERYATNVIERGRTEGASLVEGIFRVVAFDWTTAYGLHPARALGILLLVWVLLIPVYWWPIHRRTSKPTAGIFRIWPKDRVELKEADDGEPKEGEPILEKDAKIERLQAGSFRAIAWAAWFSLLSAFQIGFREFSVGNWLTRVHPRQFTLEPTGWVRTVAGLQSVLSVYLLAMWVLTYFGRPFQ
jgi:uncharacterized protein YjbI with pentapeptide repeats